MKFELTEEEIKAIKNYKNEKYITINQLLTNDAEIDIALLNQGIDFEYTESSILENIDIVKKVYEAMLKKFYQNPRRKMDTL